MIVNINCQAFILCLTMILNNIVTVNIIILFNTNINMINNMNRTILNT